VRCGRCEREYQQTMERRVEDMTWREAMEWARDNA